MNDQESLGRKLDVVVTNPCKSCTTLCRDVNQDSTEQLCLNATAIGLAEGTIGRQATAALITEKVGTDSYTRRQAIDFIIAAASNPAQA